MQTDCGATVLLDTNIGPTHRDGVTQDILRVSAARMPVEMRRARSWWPVILGIKDTRSSVQPKLKNFFPLNGIEPTENDVACTGHISTAPNFLEK